MSFSSAIYVLKRAHNIVVTRIVSLHCIADIEHWIIGETPRLLVY